MRSRVLIAILAVVVGVAGLVTFSPVLDAEFVNYDDPLNYLSNESYRGLDREHLRWMLTTGWMGHYQPLTWITLGADYARFEMSAPDYHRTGLVLHGLVGGLFFLFAIRLYGRAAPERPPAPAALVAALFFAVHPLRAETVGWLTDRGTLVAALFLVLSFWFWIPAAAESPRVARRGLALASGLPAILVLGLSCASKIAFRGCTTPCPLG